MVNPTDMNVQIDSHEHLFRSGEGNINTNGLKKDESTKFTIQYGAGYTIKIYHVLTNRLSKSRFSQYRACNLRMLT